MDGHWTDCVDREIQKRQGTRPYRPIACLNAMYGHSQQIGTGIIYVHIHWSC